MKGSNNKMRIDRAISAAPESIRAGLSRRRLLRGATAGAALSSGLASPLLAQDGEGDQARAVLPLPIPHISDVSGAVGVPAMPHVFFPGPVDGTVIATDPFGAHPDGRDPSTITNFEGFIGQVDLNFSGTGTDLETGAQSPYDFHTDTRFMQGTFVGSDERRHSGSFAFI
jgi:hypothetical protein